MNFESVCLLGDFNSRCGEIPDTLPKNAYSDASVDVIEFDKGKRISKDKLTNTMGYELLRFCKTCLIFIANGRLGKDKGIGELTCKNTSVIDYVLLSYDMFDTVIDFDILDFDEMLSDIHCAIKITFKSDWEQTCHTDEDNDVPINRQNCNERVKWNNAHTHQFIGNLNQDNIIDRLETQVDILLENTQNTTKNEMEKLVKDTTELFVDTARHLDMIKTKTNTTNKKKRRLNKPWFNSDCKRDRNAFFAAKHKHNSNKEDQNAKNDRKKR